MENTARESAGRRAGLEPHSTGSSQTAYCLRGQVERPVRGQLAGTTVSQMGPQGGGESPLRLLEPRPLRPSQESCREGALQGPALFSGMMAADCREIAAVARFRDFPRGEALFIEGDSVHQVLLLTSGFVKVKQLGVSGAEVILRLGVPGDVVGAVDLFSAGRHCTTAQTFRICRALVWEAPVFRALVERYPVLRQNLVRLFSGYLREIEERFREVATERVAPRVARQLVRLQEQMGQSVNGTVEIGLSREELAQMTGTSLFTVSRLLSSWQARGIVSLGREAVSIRNIDSLRVVSET